MISPEEYLLSQKLLQKLFFKILPLISPEEYLLSQKLLKKLDFKILKPHYLRTIMFEPSFTQHFFIFFSNLKRSLITRDAANLKEGT